MKRSYAYHFARSQRKKPTKAEEFFWQKVRGKKIEGYKINRQVPIQHSEIEGQKFFFFPDFYCAQKQLVIEIDGGYHKTQVEYDKHREDILIDMGCSIIRFTNEEVLESWLDVKVKLIERLNSL